ncbi:MAG: hypothetical protein Q8N05_06670 [Bacteroidota bacterium]|nr:hypothetical protein [Bacteroidota bacterium]
MELLELQNIWNQYDKKISENIRLNKGILRKMLISKTEKRLNRIKVEAGIRLIISLLFVPTILMFNIQIRTTVDFYIGLSLFAGLFILACIFRVKFFLMAGKFDFSSSVSSIKKEINELEKYQLKMLRLGLLFLPIGAISIFLFAKIPFLTQETLIPLILMIIILVASFFYKTKYSYKERFRKLNQEIEEIEELEKG